MLWPQLWWVALLAALVALAGGLVAVLGAAIVEVPSAARRILVDTDAGADDAVALLELLLSEKHPL